MAPGLGEQSQMIALLCISSISLPHTRGGYPGGQLLVDVRRTSSPHTWGLSFTRVGNHMLLIAIVALFISFFHSNYSVYEYEEIVKTSAVILIQC